MKKEERDDGVFQSCIDRRRFLIGTGAVLAATVLLRDFPGFEGEALAAEVRRYPRRKIGRLSRLKPDQPKMFNYPDDGMNSASMLVKLGTPAGAGVGKDGDIVAFNTLCTHMGGPVGVLYKPAYKAVGPCPFHQATFDLTRHGMIIGGHATENLPQVLLEVEGDDIYAVGIMGLIYGRYDNVAS